MTCHVPSDMGSYCSHLVENTTLAPVRFKYLIGASFSLKKWQSLELINTLIIESLSYIYTTIHMSHVVRKWTFGYMQTAKLQVSLRICAISPEDLLFAFTNNRPWWNLRQNNKASGETVRMHRLALSFAVCICAKAYFLTTWFNYDLMILNFLAPQMIVDLDQRTVV